MVSWSICLSLALTSGSAFPREVCLTCICRKSKVAHAPTALSRSRFHIHTSVQFQSAYPRVYVDLHLCSPWYHSRNICQALMNVVQAAPLIWAGIMITMIIFSILEGNDVFLLKVTMWSQLAIFISFHDFGKAWEIHKVSADTSRGILGPRISQRPTETKSKIHKILGTWQGNCTSLTIWRDVVSRDLVHHPGEPPYLLTCALWGAGDTSLFSKYIHTFQWV